MRTNLSKGSCFTVIEQFVMISLHLKPTHYEIKSRTHRIFAVHSFSTAYPIRHDGPPHIDQESSHYEGRQKHAHFASPVDMENQKPVESHHGSRRESHCT